MNTALEPYRHVDIVRVEECASCIARYEKSERRWRAIEAAGIAGIKVAPWSIMSMLGVWSANARQNDFLLVMFLLAGMISIFIGIVFTTEAYGKRR